MLIRADCNYIYCGIVTEIDKFMLNLVNLSITSSEKNVLTIIFVILNGVWEGG